MVAYLRILRGFNRDIRLLLCLQAAVGFVYFGVQAVLYNLYLLRLGYDAGFIGTLSGLGQLTWAACALPAGALGKRIGLRQAIQWGMLISVAANALFLLVEALPQGARLPWLVVVTLITWVGSALYTVNNVPYMMALTRQEQRGHAFTVQSGLYSLLGFAGSLLAGALPGVLAAWQGSSLESAAPYRQALWLGPPVLALGLLAVSAARPAQTEEEAQVAAQVAAQDVAHSAAQSVRPARSPAPVGLFAFLGLVFFLQSASLGVLIFFNVFLDAGLRVSTGEIGAIMGFGQLLPFLAALTAPVLLSRWGSGRSLAFSALAAAGFMLPIAAASGRAAAALGLVGANSMGAILFTARMLFSQEVVAPRWRTTTSAINTIGLALGWSLIAFTGGQVLIPAFGFSGFFLVGAGIGLVSALLLGVYLRRRKDVQPAAPPETSIQGERVSGELG